MTNRYLKIYALLFVCLCAIPFSSNAVKPTPAKSAQGITLNEKTIIQELEKAKGKKLTVIEKIFAKSAIKKARKKPKKKKNNGEVKKGMATAALVLGVASFVVAAIPIAGILAVPAAILAIVFGAIALKRAKNDPENYGGKGLALAGLICGLVFIIILLIIIAILIATIALLF